MTYKTTLFVSIISFLICNSICSAQAIEINNKVPAVDPSGYLSITADVDSFYVVINDDFKNVHHVAGGDTLALKSGKNKIRVVKKYYQDLVRSYNIKADSVMMVRTNLFPFKNFKYYKDDSSYPRLFWGAPVIVKTDPDARMYVNGTYIGSGIGRVDTTGYFTVVSELPSGGVKTKKFYADESKQTFFVKEIYHRPEKKKARFLALVPGASQLYQEDKIKGYAILGATLIGTGLAVKFNQDFTTKYQLFENTQTRYNSASDPATALELGNLAEQQLIGSNQTANLRDLFIFGAAGIYLYNLVDAFLRPNIGYRNKIEIDPYIDFDRNYNKTVGLNASYRF